MSPGAYALVGAFLFLSATGCSRPGKTTEIAALESAYKSGVLTKDEYTAKLAAIQTRTAQLVALNRAMKAGLLSKDEYLAKRAAVLAAAAPAGVVTPPVASPAGVTSDAPTPAYTPSPATPADPTSSQVAPATQTTPASDPQGHSYRMKMAQILDSQGFDHPIPSATVLIPVDWQSQGATTWNLKDQCNGVATHLLVSGPDGRAFERFPVYQWVWADDPRAYQASFAQSAQMGKHACDVMQPMGAQDYLRQNLSKLRPNAQFVGFEPAPKLMEDLQTQAKQTEEWASHANMRQQVKFDAIKARVKYSVDGKPMEEWILAAVVTTGTFGPMQKWTYSCVAYTAGQRAPAGQLENSEKLFQLIASTYRAGSEWQARMTKNALALQQIQLKGIRDRSAIVAKSAEDQRNIRRQTYENQQKAQDSTNNGFSQYIRGVETYRNPSTGESVDLDSRYGHAWVSPQGVYLLSDQAGFDPNSVPGNTQSWTQLQQVKK